MDEDYKNFALLVEKMRKWQKRYFKERSDIALRTSKALEREVDRWIVEMNPNGEPRQGNLF